MRKINGAMEAVTKWTTRPGEALLRSKIPSLSFWNSLVLKNEPNEKEGGHANPGRPKSRLSPGLGQWEAGPRTICTNPSGRIHFANAARTWLAVMPKYSFAARCGSSSGRPI